MRPRSVTRGRSQPATGDAALRRQIALLSARLEEAEATLSAIRSGEVDALVVSTPGGESVYTLKGADHAYRIFLEDMGEGALILSGDGLVLYANQRFARIVGVPLGRVIGGGIFRFLRPAAGRALRKTLASFPACGFRREATLETPAGRIPVLLSLNALPESDPPAICIVVTDLTERMRSHEKLLEAHRAVAESERRFRFLVDNSLVGFFIAMGGQIVFGNPEQRRIFGGLPIPVAVKDLKNVLPPDRKRFERLCDETAVSKSGTMEAEIRFCPETRTAGTRGPLWAHVRAASIEYKGKKAVLVNMVDVTRTREIEQIAAVQDKMASLGQMTAGVAHNIRNPLSGINMSLYNLKNVLDKATGLDVQSKEAAGGILAMLLEGSSKISNVVRLVLDFAKPSPSEMTLVNVDSAVRQAVELCGAGLKNAGIALSVDVPKELPPCYANSGILEQVFINVIQNATQALEKHAGVRRIAISAGQSNGFVVVRIADSGPGIPVNLREKVFELFFTTNSAGTGIGLAFSRRVLQSLGSFIEVEDSALGGAEFRIEIPVGGRKKSRRKR